ncbi:MAG: phosphatase PAP2 family protein [Ardenticatenaceae bacterium]|nr:phosphatase PAP2 family protein [Ardenticatenaceae bacterium]MCB9445764.1 phosphatase PAP2 family protein [Ardenticatenaceae bacterium]
MEPIYTFGLEATRWLQATLPQLEGFFKVITSMGEENFYLVILPLIYWCLDKRLGKNLVYLFLLADGVNVLGKHAFRGPRPFWLDPSVGLSQSEGYGVPSGHTQLTTVIYGLVAVWYKRAWLTWLAVFMIVAMGLSRIYLGVHFVHDVVAGFLIGLIILISYFAWRRYSGGRFDKLFLGRKLFWAVIIPLGLAVAYVIARLIIGDPNTAVPWAKFIPDAELNGLEGMATAIGTLLGFGIGVNLEASRTRFLVAGPIWQRAVRYVLGLVVTLVIYLGLRAVFPADPLWLGVPLRILRYMLLTLWMSYYGPALFVKLGLASANPEPEIKVAL